MVTRDLTLISNKKLKILVDRNLSKFVYCQSLTEFKFKSFPVFYNLTVLPILDKFIQQSVLECWRLVLTFELIGSRYP